MSHNRLDCGAHKSVRAPMPGETHQLRPAIAEPVIAATDVRYIKLGRGNEHAGACLQGGYIGLGFDTVPHEVCARGDWAAVRSHFLEVEGKSPAKAADHTRELRAFYEDAEALWITFFDGRLWWAFADPAVTWEPALSGQLPRRRKTNRPWRATDLTGAPLRMRDLSTRLTSVAYYRGTICEVRARTYLLNKLNARVDPLIADAEQVRAQMHRIARDLIAQLHPRDFEIMVDLILTGSGWRRISILGESEADTDLIVEQAATGERAFVQVKSRATPAVLDDYVERFRARGDCSRMFFVCHTPSARLAAHAVVDPRVDLWISEALSEKAVRAGLYGWLIERAK